MDLQPSEEERLLAESARKVFERDCPTTLVRELREDTSAGHSDELWSKIASQGWLGLGLPERHGGAGGLVDLGLVMEEAGRALVPTTFRSTVQAAQLIALAGTDAQQARLLAPIVEGRSLSSVAVAEPRAIHDLRHIEATASPAGDEWVLSGVKTFVANAHLADPLLVVARTGGGSLERSLSVFSVAKGTPGVSIEPHSTFAHDRQFRVRLDSVALSADDRLGALDGPPAAAGLEEARLRWVALLCAEMVGGNLRVLDMTAEYVRARVQFGRPIGSFQAVQHHIANMGAGADAARLATYQALWRLATGRGAAREVSIAKAWTGRAYKEATVMAHQLHGGYGYVREHDLHLWSEHAKACEVALGGRDLHLLAVARELGL
ncbi:MAG TPA: acyl-CoA dehydrogenase family protein [Acidimicrobiales bacterium]|nr:acyl-CoA dehydrogenase family protein [Acidimicrobiales bacterium]